MKRLFFVLSVSFILVGCGENKITNEMLVGEWQCDATEKRADWDEDTFQEFGEASQKNRQIGFKVEGDKLYSKLYGFDWMVPTFDNQKILNYTQDNGDYTVTIDNVIESLSETKMTIAYEITFLWHESYLQNIRNMKLKGKQTCTLIKK